MYEIKREGNIDMYDITVLSDLSESYVFSLVNVQ